MVGVVLLLPAPVATASTPPDEPSARVTTSASQKALPTKAEWLADVRSALSGSRAYLSARATTGVVMPAVVLDIDNTSIASHYDWPRPVKPTLAFARRARDLGATVHFVTARRSGTLGKVRSLLKDAGYQFQGICGRKQGESIVHGKVRCRRALSRQGYTIIANVGNRATDFRGGNYERGFRLPSYQGRLP